MINKTDTTPHHPKAKGKRKSGELPVVGISIGDINGIGPEVVIKALEDKRILSMMTPIIYGSSKVLSFYRKELQLEQFNFMTIKDIEHIAYGKVNVINCWEEQVAVTPGQVTDTGGNTAWIALKRATEELKSGFLDAVVTAPINKNNIQNKEFNFAGHTEFFTQTFKAKESLMFLVHENLRVGVVTGHIPLQAVSQSLTRDKIRRKLLIMDKSLAYDFGKQKPRIAVLGLNPHAGEEGLLGSEEQDIIKPVIQEMKEEGKLVFGPFPADGFFGSLLHQQFDGVMAMYHDQGLVPFKTLAFEKGVNFTAGLPIVRTSPDHGTAYDIAGKNEANPVSMREALYVACDVIRSRKEFGPEER